MSAPCPQKDGALPFNRVQGRSAVLAEMQGFIKAYVVARLRRQEDQWLAPGCRNQTNNQRKIVFAAILGDMLDFFDFYLIGFVLAFIVGSWKLTYGQSAMILLSSGLGAVPGALFWGWLADRIGRRKVFIHDRAELLARHRHHGADARAGRLDFPHVLPLPGGLRRLWIVRCRSAAGAGVRADIEAWPGRRARHIVPASRQHARRVSRRLSGAGHRLARAVRRRPAAGADHAADPRLGAGIAALADPHGPCRGSASGARLGVADRSGQHHAACQRAGAAAHALARTVPLSAQHDAVHAHQPGHPDDGHRPGAVGADAVRAGIVDLAGGSIVPDDLGRPWPD